MEKEKIIRETTEKLVNGIISKEEADKILIEALAKKRCRSVAVARGYKHCNMCTREACHEYY